MQIGKKKKKKTAKNNKMVIFCMLCLSCSKSVFFPLLFYVSYFYSNFFLLHGRRDFNIYRHTYRFFIYMYVHTHMYVGACIYTNIGKFISFSFEKMSRVFIFFQLALEGEA